MCSIDSGGYTVISDGDNSMKWLASCLMAMVCSMSSNSVEADGKYVVTDVKYGTVYENDFAMRAYKGTFDVNTGMVSWQEVTPPNDNPQPSELVRQCGWKF